jgi:sugar phosphate isomerase/epimerase
MYTVREQCATPEGFAESLRRIAEIGYKCVQLSGGGDFPAPFVRETADRHGLAVVSTHTACELILNQTEKVASDHKLLGAPYVGIGMMPEAYRHSREGALRFIAAFTPAAEYFAREGLKLMYHNHALEFERFGGELCVDILADGFPPELMGFTLDVYWAAYAGADPAYWLERLAGRVDTIHFKDMKIARGKQLMAEVMEGNLNWPAIFRACETAGVKWAFVEQDDCGEADPFDCLRTSFENIGRARGAGRRP